MTKELPNIIHIFGASGSGTSTLGEAIEQKYGHKHLDVDDYFWLPTNPPFSTPRARDERQMLLQNDIEKSKKCVVTGSLCGWGDLFIEMFELVVFLDVPSNERIERIKKREYERFGDRILFGGDMFEKHQNFIEWAKSYDVAGENTRSRKMHQK